MREARTFDHTILVPEIEDLSYEKSLLSDWQRVMASMGLESGLLSKFVNGLRG